MLSGYFVKLHSKVNFFFIKLLGIIYRSKEKIETQRIGDTYGGWIVPKNWLNQNSVCCLAGVGENITFDIGLVENTGCRVHLFDPTPRSIKFMETAIPQNLKNHVDFYPFGLWSENTKVRFFAPKDPLHVSHSAVNLQGTSEYFDAECINIEKMMELIEMDLINILKLDIEGAEYEVLRSMRDLDVRPDILCVEFDQPVFIGRTVKEIRELIRYGYSIVAVEKANVTFVCANGLDINVIRN